MLNNPEICALWEQHIYFSYSHMSGHIANTWAPCIFKALSSLFPWNMHINYTLHCIKYAQVAAGWALLKDRTKHLHCSCVCMCVLEEMTLLSLGGMTDGYIQGLVKVSNPNDWLVWSGNRLLCLKFLCLLSYLRANCVTWLFDQIFLQRPFYHWPLNLNELLIKILYITRN